MIKSLNANIVDKLRNSIAGPTFILFLTGLIFSFGYMFTQIMVVDSLQLLERGYMFAQGYLIPFGPKSTNTNLIYGPFISIYSGIFLKLFDSPYSLLGGICFFHVIGFWAITQTQYLKKNTLFYFTYLLLYWCSPWRANEVFIWNPSFLIPFASIYLYSIDLFLRNRRFYGTLLQGFIVILCSQTHNSFIFLGFLSLGLWYKKIIRPHWGGVFLCVLLSALFLLPTFVVLQMHPEILNLNRDRGVHLFGNLLKGGEALKGFTYWFRYSSLYFSSTLLKSDLPPSWPSQIWNVIKWVLAVSSTLIVAWLNFRFFIKKRIEHSILKTIALMALFSLMISSCISPVSFNYWHLYLAYPFTIIPVASEIALFSHQKKIVTGLFIYFILVVVLTVISSEEHKWDSNLEAPYQEKVTNRKNELIEKFKIMAIKFE